MKDEELISKRPLKCECGETNFTETQTAWKCNNCGRNHGKTLVKSWVDRKVGNKFERIIETNARPGLEYAKEIEKKLDQEGNIIEVISRTIDLKARAILKEEKKILKNHYNN